MLPTIAETLNGADLETVNEQLDVFPLTSVAVITTGVIPTGKLDPEAGTDTMDEIPQLSEALRGQVA